MAKKETVEVLEEVTGTEEVAEVAEVAPEVITKSFKCDNCEDSGLLCYKCK